MKPFLSQDQPSASSDEPLPVSDVLLPHLRGDINGDDVSMDPVVQDLVTLGNHGETIGHPIVTIENQHLLIGHPRKPTFSMVDVPLLCSPKGTRDSHPCGKHPVWMVLALATKQPHDAQVSIVALHQSNSPVVG